MSATFQKNGSGLLFIPGPAKDFLRALGKREEETRFRAFAPKGHPHRSEIGSRKRKGFDHRSFNQWQREGRGLYAVINNGGDKSAEITNCIALFCEWDDRPIDWQMQAWQKLGLPEPTLMVSTGGKSVHCYWVLDRPIHIDQWQQLQNRLIAHAGSDPACKDASRVMRLPGSTYLDADGTAKGVVEIIQNSGLRYTAEVMAKTLPDIQEPQVPPAPPGQLIPFPSVGKPRTLPEIKEALDCIPRRVSGHGTYESYRNVLWGLVAAVEEAGGTIDQAIALMEAHSPSAISGWDVDQVARSGDGRIKAGTFWKVAKEHGYQLSQRLAPGSAPLQAPAPENQQVDSPELELESKDSDWLPIVMKLAFDPDRWLHIEGILHRWSGTHYEPHPDQALAPRVAPVLKRLFYINKTTKETIHQWARPARITEAIEWFRKTLPPCTDYNPSNAINCRNGTLSWTWNGDRMVLTFAPHDPAQPFTYCLPYDYDPQADGTHLWRLLDALEPQDRDTMQRLLGSGLQLERYRASKGRPCALLLLGDGENGKDTIRGALKLTLGDQGMTGCTLSDFQQYDKGRKFPIAPLRGARINWSPENTSYARLEGIQSLKGAITGDEMSCEQKNLQEQPFIPNAIFLFNCNQPPLMDAGQAAMQSRWHAVRFLKRYSSYPDPNEPNHLQADPRLKDDLGFIRENICPAMLNWLLEGLQLAVRDGINFRSTPETIIAIRRQSCHLFDFAEDVGLVVDPTAELEHKTLWVRLVGWYQEQKILHIDDKGRFIWNDRDMRGDPPVRIPRDLERRLKAVFPKLTSRKAPKTRIALLKGVALA